MKARLDLQVHTYSTQIHEHTYTPTHTLTCPARVWPAQVKFTACFSCLGATSGGEMEAVGLGVETESLFVYILRKGNDSLEHVQFGFILSRQ